MSGCIFNILCLGHLIEKRSKLNEFYTKKRLFLAILTQSYIWQEDSWNFYFLAKMALFCPNKLPRSVSLSGMVFLYSWAGPFWTPESCAQSTWSTIINVLKIRNLSNSNMKKALFSQHMCQFENNLKTAKKESKLRLKNKQFLSYSQKHGRNNYSISTGCNWQVGVY